MIYITPNLSFVVDNTEDKHTYNVHFFTQIILLYLLPIDLEADLPPLEREVPTRLYISGAWLAGPLNPGLYGRGLQHRPPREPWPPCPDPSHHACLDHLPLDGSLARLK